MTITLLQGDCLSVLATLPAGAIQTVITSPPYFNLRRYSDDPREIGQEAAPDCLAWARSEPPCGACYVCALRAVFAAVWRVLRDDGTCWINLGDSMSMDSKWGGASGGKNYTSTAGGIPRGRKNAGIPDKNLLLIPARVALALQSDGWIVRSDVIWSKPNGMPESVTDRPTRAHEYVYLLSKQARYYYDAAAIAEPSTGQNGAAANFKRTTKDHVIPGQSAAQHRLEREPTADNGTRNKRSVWHISTKSYSGAHFATFPEALVEIPLLAGSSAMACEHCGAAWGRTTEREPILHRPNSASIRGHSPSAHRAPGQPQQGSRSVSVTTLGFAPRCACALNTGAAASAVLDPFAGTGTVLRVAERFGRNAIGIELNPDYGELSDARTNGVQKELFI